MRMQENALVVVSVLHLRCSNKEPGHDRPRVALNMLKSI